MRIVSLLPAATDIVVELGLAGDLVGRTHECDWPPGGGRVRPGGHGGGVSADGMSSREISDAVGGAAHRGSSLYSLDAERLAELAPGRGADAGSVRRVRRLLHRACRGRCASWTAGPG